MGVGVRVPWDFTDPSSLNVEIPTIMKKTNKHFLVPIFLFGFNGPFPTRLPVGAEPQPETFQQSQPSLCYRVPHVSVD